MSFAFVKENLSFILPEVLCCLVLQYLPPDLWKFRSLLGDREPQFICCLQDQNTYWHKILKTCCLSCTGKTIWENDVTKMNILSTEKSCCKNTFRICLKVANLHYHGVWEVAPSFLCYNQEFKCIELTPAEDYLIWNVCNMGFLWVNMTHKCIERIYLNKIWQISEMEWNSEKQKLAIYQLFCGWTIYTLGDKLHQN